MLERLGNALGGLGTVFMRRVTRESRESSSQHSSGEKDAENHAASLHAGDEFGVGGEGRASSTVGETGEVLGGGVEAEVDAEIEGVLEGGTEEGVIDEDKSGRGEGLGGGDGAADIGHADGGVGGRFDKDDARLGGTDGIVEFLGAAGVDGHSLNAERFQKLVDEVLGAAVERDRINNLVAGSGKGGEGGHDRGHAGIEDGGGARATSRGTNWSSRISALGWLTRA